ncbi:MAG: dTMP kinase [candidate division NC10 bacterium]|nr:dTMP kinase [candidate division NC10 bacterium]
MRKGLLISLEGGEGSGKSTQLELLAASLEAMGRKVLKTREPGGTRLGEQVRALLLRAEGVRISPMAELLLYLACRAQLVEEVIRPALEEGWIILADRYLDASVAYQGYGRGLDPGMIEEMNRKVVGDALPDLTLLLDLEARAGLDRISPQGRDRLEGEGLAFHERVREGYLHLAAQHPSRIKVISARKEASATAAEIKGYVLPLLPPLA